MSIIDPYLLLFHQIGLYLTSKMMGRFFIEISYHGASFAGWQRQPNAETVQERIESALGSIFNRKVEITGCGRTDTGVHATNYYFHVDLLMGLLLPKDLLFKLNSMCGPSIGFHRIIPVNDTAHARFDALSRTYRYHILFKKNVFRQGLAYLYDQPGVPDLEMTNQAATLLNEFDEFYPFCKTHSDVSNYKCRIMHSCWNRINETEWEYTITANRFLRGMVRLIVGMCLNVGNGRLKIEDVRSSLSDQTRLSRPWSVPAEGLYLTKINYPYID